jgi:hypothetical protein
MNKSIEADLASLLTEGTRPLGFRRRGNNWFRTGATVYSIVNLQRSRWDETLYVNIGFDAAANVPGDWRPERQCGVRFRIDAIDAVTAADLRLLDQEQQDRLGTEAWRTAVVERLVEPMVRVLVQATDISGLRDVLTTAVSRRVMIRADMRGLVAPA